MNINELFGSENEDEKKLGFDLKDDLVFFMNHDPEFYRKHYFPVMLKFDQYQKEGKNVTPKGFEKLVKEAYAIYQSKFPVEGLESTLKDSMCEEICKEIHQRELKNCEDGVYDLED